MPTVAALHDKVVVWAAGGSRTLAGVGQVRPAGVEADTTNVIVPTKPNLVIVIVEVPEDPTICVAGLTAPALIVKSGFTVRGTVVV